MLALVWGVGGTVDIPGRAAFSKALREFLKGVCFCSCTEVMCSGLRRGSLSQCILAVTDAV